MRGAWVVVVVALAGCGGAARPRAPVKPKPVSPAPTASVATTAAPVDPLGSFDAMIADSGSIWPGSRVLDQKEAALEDGHPLSLALAPNERDVCYRAFAKGLDVVDVSLVTESGDVLARAKGKDAAIGEKGPVCLRKGSKATVTVGGSSRVRLVVRASP